MKKKPVVIYQMGKVASSSIESSLSKIADLNVIHTHHLNPIYTKQLNDLKKQMGWKTNISPASVAKLSKNIFSEKKLYFISLVREPVGRNISAYFQNLDTIFRKGNAHNELSTEQIRQGFLTKYPHSVATTWFDNEFNKVLGIDIYTHPFPKNQGVLSIKKGNHRVLVMQYDIDDSDKEAHIKEFLGINDFELRRENEAKTKAYSAAYNNFTQTISLPNFYIKEMLDSRYAKHFFKHEKLEFLKAKWGKKPQALNQ